MTCSPHALPYYLKATAGLTSSRFLEDHDHPVLIWSKSLDWTERITYQFETSIIEGDRDSPLNELAKTASQVTATLVIEVRKKTPQGPSSMICTGRASNNDIVFPHKTVSKLHAYFLRTARRDAYEIVDANSTNGTKVNNRTLTAHQHHAVVNRDRIHFGPSIQVMYLTALGFYDFLQQLLRCGIF